MSKYIDEIKSRSRIKFLLGIITRLKKFILNQLIVLVAKKNGAMIGHNVTMPFELAKKSNKNLRIGNNTSIHTSQIDLRLPINIGNNVIIGSNVEIITVSHNIDSIDWEHKYYGCTIEDYVWISTKALILPSARVIGYGSIIGAGSVLSKNTESMDIMVGNPATLLRKRKLVHTDLCVQSLLGNDLITYIKTYLNN